MSDTLSAATTPRQPSLLGAVPLVGVGQKMYLDRTESLTYLQALAGAARDLDGVGVFVLPTFLVLADAALILRGSPVILGAQDCADADYGPYTGSVSPAMLRETGCSLVELGHHERRSMFCESDELIARKAVAADRNGLIPLVCVGEVGPDDDAADAVRRQAGAVLSALSPDAPVLFAYEPAWAIGAEASARPCHIEVAREVIDALAGNRPGVTRVLYGGSVTAEGVGDVMRAGLDGVFVGRGALQVTDVVRIVTEVRASWQRR